MSVLEKAMLHVEFIDYFICFNNALIDSMHVKLSAVEIILYQSISCLNSTLEKNYPKIKDFLI